MKKTTMLLILVFCLMAIAIKLVFFPSKSSLSSPYSNKQEGKVNIEPSKTLKTYSDPSGFSFNYPDNLSLLNNELKDANTYADLQLTAKGAEGAMHLKISDSKFKSIDEWVKSTGTKETPKEVKLGNLKALEITADDKLLLGSLDSAVLFTVEIPISEKKDFWMSVYSSVLKDFSFAPPSDNTASGGTNSSDPVSFESEEVVE